MQSSSVPMSRVLSTRTGAKLTKPHASTEKATECSAVRLSFAQPCRASPTTGSERCGHNFCLRSHLALLNCVLRAEALSHHGDVSRTMNSPCLIALSHPS